MHSLDIIVMCAAFLGSTLAGLFGGGAGLIFTPTIYLFLNAMNPHSDHIMQTSITTMIASLIPSGILATIKHNKYQHIDWSTFKWSTPLICLGAGLGCFLMTMVSSKVIMYVFSITTLFLALKGTHKILKQHQQQTIETNQTPSFLFKYVGSICLGLICTLSGAASFAVPYYEKLGLSIKKAIGTTTISVLSYSVIVLIFMTCLGLKETHLPNGNIGFLNYQYLILLMLPTFPGALLGAKLANLLPEKKLKISFLILMYFIGLSMFVKAIH